MIVFAQPFEHPLQTVAVPGSRLRPHFRQVILEGQKNFENVLYFSLKNRTEVSSSAETNRKIYSTNSMIYSINTICGIFRRSVDSQIIICGTFRYSLLFCPHRHRTCRNNRSQASNFHFSRILVKNEQAVGTHITSVRKTPNLHSLPANFERWHRYCL